MDMWTPYLNLVREHNPRPVFDSLGDTPILGSFFIPATAGRAAPESLFTAKSLFYPTQSKPLS